MHTNIYGALFLAVLSNVLVAVANRCLTGSLIGCSCLVVKQSPSGLTWNEASRNCTLASLKSLNQTKALEANFISRESWIGIKTCIAVQTTRVWRASDCSEKHRFVCERTSGTADCLGWKNNTDRRCYKLSEAAMNFTNAQKKCTGMKAKLAEIFTRDQYSFIRKNVYGGNESMDAWLGLRVSKASNYTYISNGSTPNDTLLGVEFKPTQGKDCVTIELNKNDVVWKKKQCDTKLRWYICQIQTGLQFNITNVNETSANISWSVTPENLCGPSNITITLSEGGNKPVREIKISNEETWWLVDDLRPETQYEVQITRSNFKNSFKFQTKNITNRLQLLNHTSSSPVHAKTGDTVALLCAAKGEPPITFTWKKDKVTLPSYMVTKHPYPSSILSVTLTNQTMYGEYVCSIQDRFSNKNYTVVIDGVQKGVSEDGNNNIFVIIIIILAAVVAICLVIIILYIRYARTLKRQVKETKRAGNIIMTSVTNEAKQDIPQAPSKTVNEYNVSPVDENATYTALNRQEVNEEDNFYSPLTESEPPLYENAHILPDTA